ncbi:uncharacterized protein EI90DRAFT_459921 [Cantharellus anzutake]|uniref:uncharacterized protein n=1 Tax=Cantharellus anzutake TaxID=1750568 RepID=UPI001905B70B|nr:uncharacterized protein EI90DRAFT_459921 [Cantharellus anzutake]KAF8334744.1 hypothetical protein EI90DRAFT_459921 [Cantharellus anzutake]
MLVKYCEFGPAESRQVITDVYEDPVPIAWVAPLDALAPWQPSIPRHRHHTPQSSINNHHRDESQNRPLSVNFKRVVGCPGTYPIDIFFWDFDWLFFCLKDASISRSSVPRMSQVTNALPRRRSIHFEVPEKSLQCDRHNEVISLHYGFARNTTSI